MVYWYKSDFRFGKDKWAVTMWTSLYLTDLTFDFICDKKFSFSRNVYSFSPRKKIVEYGKTKETPGKNE